MNKKLHDELSTLPNTTAGRRIRSLATMRYLHVSKGLAPEVYQLAQRFPKLAADVLRSQRGDTLNIGANATKRWHDQIFVGPLAKFGRACARKALARKENSYA